MLLADSHDAQFLSGLRERRLFELAEMYCLDWLRQETQNGMAESELTLELIRTLALHAAHAPADRRAALWASARKTAADYLRRSPAPPRAILIRVQNALTPLALGELSRQEAEAGVIAAADLEPARQALREATSLLEGLDKELTREIPLRRRTPPRTGELTADELFGLHQDVQLQLARAQRNRALLAEAGSDDRRALLLVAIETLNRPLAQLTEDDALRAAIQLDLAQCRRLLGEPATAGQIAAAIDQPGLSPDVRLRARAERIRAALAQRDLAAAKQLLEQPRTIADQSAGDLEFARFEALLALAGSAKEPEAKSYQEQAADAAKSLDEGFGAYWGRRADQLLIASLPRGDGTGNVELLSRQADSLYQKRDFERAIAAYDEASSAARSAGNLQRAFELAYKAALVEQQRGRHAAVASRLRILTKGLASHAQAPAAHLLAAWNAAQASQEDPAAAELYVELLREHVSIWPSAESASQARLWLGRLTESRSDLAGAITHYAVVAPASPHYAAAIAALTSCWRQNLAKMAAAGQPTALPASEAIRFFAAAAQRTSPPGGVERAATLALAELILSYEPSRAADAEKVLREALSASNDTPAAWRTEAQSQLVVALAAQPSREMESVDVLRQIGSASPAQLFAVLEGLTRIAARSSGESRRAVAATQLAAVNLLATSRQQLGAKEQLSLGQIEAEALAAAGRRDEALAAYARLSEAHPDDASVQAGFAALLLDSTDRRQLEQALDQWRTVAARCKPRTTRWQQAKYSVALAQFKLGDRAGASALLRYILETPPGLAGSEWEAKYALLLKRCQP